MLVFLMSAYFIRWKFNIRAYKNLKQGFIVQSIIFVIAIAWDYLGTWRGHWAFPGKGLIGLRIAGLPIEEFLFMIIVSYWVIIFYKFMMTKLRKVK
jgi:lycopene cyclase domain-containing protein